MQIKHSLKTCIILSGPTLCGDFYSLLLLETPTLNSRAVWAKRCTVQVLFQKGYAVQLQSLTSGLQLVHLLGSHSFRAAPGQELSMAVVLGPGYLSPARSPQMGTLCSEFPKGWQSLCQSASYSDA